MYRSSPFRSTLNTGYIKLWTCVALDQCKLWTPFGHFCPYFHTPYTLLCPKDEFTFTFRRGLIWKIDNPSTTLSLAPGIFDNPYKGAESAGCHKLPTSTGDRATSSSSNTTLLRGSQWHPIGAIIPLMLNPCNNKIPFSTDVVSPPLVCWFHCSDNDSAILQGCKKKNTTKSASQGRTTICDIREVEVPVRSDTKTYILLSLQKEKTSSIRKDEQVQKVNTPLQPFKAHHHQQLRKKMSAPTKACSKAVDHTAHSDKSM